MPEPPVVILIHGIRTAAWWQNRIASVIESETSATVIPIKYGYFDLLRFWCPFGICRAGPIEKLRQQIEGVSKHYGDGPLIVFAHSYGTYALTRVILQNPYFRFDRIILCGSVVPGDWRAVEDQIRGPEKRNAIINECGTRDIWPVLAQSGTWGYGATGTYGFGTFNVRDRFHDITHSEYFTNEFVKANWIPLVRGEKVTFSDVDTQGGGTPAWFNLLRLPLKWIPFVAAASVAAVLALHPVWIFGGCASGTRPYKDQCVTEDWLAGRKDLKKQLGDVVAEVNKTLDLKGGRLFPLMDEYEADPTPEKWAEIVQVADVLLKQIDDGVAKALDYDSRLVSVGNNITLITSTGKQAVEKKYSNPFVTVEKQWNGRQFVVNQIVKVKEMPTVEQARQWHQQLFEMHQQLTVEMQKLMDLLDDDGEPGGSSA
ncbi:alpha/beta hydrolase [Mesorhizobium sp. AR02]|uniref:alpha/beta fold hydrolase n=1 Tax=Mesorhizobium sp. AR02 TaxID=2865837 RepID=UPI00215FF0CC|nr:alpha/beta hydrolase [Mesorhizobium sp. AR02]UVK52196.1 alpha/beta hydrolase [Mesorhizobium sp. AR02]